MQPTEIQPADFAENMKALADEAQKHMEDGSYRKTPPTFLQMLRPLVLGLEALSRATTENTMTLTRLESASHNHEALPRMISDIQEKVDGRNNVNQQLFDALHEELKGYKDAFILEALQKPLVRDLIALYDDITEIHRQMVVFKGALDAMPQGSLPGHSVSSHLNTVGTNLDHTVHFLVEIMARMELTPLEPHTGKLDKTLQRAVDVEPADSEAEDGDIVSSMKQGFLWRGRIIRPEEVVVKKWKDGYLVALNTAAEHPAENCGVQSGMSDAIGYSAPTTQTQP
jgi:molecular chaperone GrpE (heat shock protein)